MAVHAAMSAPLVGSSFVTLPPNVFAEIAVFLDVERIAALSVTCSAVRHLCLGAHRSVWVPVLDRLCFGTFPSTCWSKPQNAKSHAEKILRFSLTAQQDVSWAGSSMLSLLQVDERLGAFHELFSKLVNFFGNQRLVQDFLRLLADAIVEILRPFTGVDHDEWLKILACRLFARGFERFVRQVKDFHYLISLSAPKSRSRTPQTRDVKVVEYFLLLLSYQRTLLNTHVSDLEAVQELCSTLASSPVVTSGMELLKYHHKEFKSNRAAAQLYEECLGMTQAMTAAALLSEISDHPAAQAKYDSVWAAYRGTKGSVVSALSVNNNDDTSFACVSIPLASENYGCLTRSQKTRLRRIDALTLADLVSYMLRISRSDRRHFLENVRSIFQLTMSTIAAHYSE